MIHVTRVSFPIAFETRRKTIKSISILRKIFITHKVLLHSVSVSGWGRTDIQTFRIYVSRVHKFLNRQLLDLEKLNARKPMQIDLLINFLNKISDLSLKID